MRIDLKPDSFEFKHISDNSTVSVTTEEVSLPEIVDAFGRFLKAVGFSFHELEIIRDSDVQDDLKDRMADMQERINELEVLLDNVDEAAFLHRLSQGQDL